MLESVLMVRIRRQFSTTVFVIIDRRRTSCRNHNPPFWQRKIAVEDLFPSQFFPAEPVSLRRKTGNKVNATTIESTLTEGRIPFHRESESGDGNFPWVDRIDKTKKFFLFQIVSHTVNEAKGDAGER
jgi:hypothetical protein